MFTHKQNQYTVLTWPISIYLHNKQKTEKTKRFKCIIKCKITCSDRKADRKKRLILRYSIFKRQWYELHSLSLSCLSHFVADRVKCVEFGVVFIRWRHSQTWRFRLIKPVSKNSHRKMHGQIEYLPPTNVQGLKITGKADWNIVFFHHNQFTASEIHDLES